MTSITEMYKFFNYLLKQLRNLISYKSLLLLLFAGGVPTLRVVGG